MSQDFIQQLLQEWDLPALCSVFVDHEIDEESFLTLNESEIKELIPAIGILSNGNNSIQSIADLEDTQSIQSIIDLDDIHPQNYYPQKATVGASYVITSYSTSPRETVRKLLDSTEEGLIIKNSYGSSKQFLRSNLCTLIIKNELKHSDDKRISTERFKQLAQEINNIFIHEDPSTYYLPYTRGKVVAARGKLWSTYVHQRKIYREAGLIKKQITVEPSTSNDKRFVNISGEDEDSLIWLKNNGQPFEDVSQHWRKNTKLRVQLFKDETIADYFKKYPALRLQTGYILLDIDFNYLFEDKQNLLFTKWPMVSELLFKTLLKKKDSLLKDCLAQEKYDTLNKDAKEVMVLKYLPLLLQSPLIKAKPKHWKPSKRELIDGFVLFIHDISDLNKKIEERQTKCEQFKIPVQPIPIVVGPYGHCQCFVSVDDVLYGVENPIKAIDV
ncbi:hypothetical protein ILUMI_00916 [Ignelater luminosus]|uniref:Uncharacterized protein n=1 Tax=Ignelater luminosus TaxID=2038154 RepID=A0A8K0GHY7_IGNLU|nr:hypothetical protein ILUMI_00916 [Ignelater luminosus]